MKGGSCPRSTSIFPLRLTRKNRRKAINKLARKHLKVTTIQRKDFAVKIARALIQSSDLVAYEDLKVSNLVRNHRLAKSISDVSWGYGSLTLGEKTTSV